MLSMMKLQGLGRQGKVCAAASDVAVIEGNGEASWQGKLLHSLWTRFQPLLSGITELQVTARRNGSLVLSPHSGDRLSGWLVSWDPYEPYLSYNLCLHV